MLAGLCVSTHLIETSHMSMNSIQPRDTGCMVEGKGDQESLTLSWTMESHAFNPSPGGHSQNLRPAWSTEIQDSQGYRDNKQTNKQTRIPDIVT